ncbi:MAG: phosphoglycolate phosphatase [Gammaproteobacteria bacterium]|nr:phosphoglycolate phosphatase [Gammaproteobacteria bacterium]
MTTAQPDNGISCVLFDLDGTLVDTAPDMANALNRTLVNHGRQPLAFETIRPSVSLGGVALVKLAFELDEADPELDRLRKEFLAIYRDNLSRESCLFPGMELVLAGLEEISASWGIVTNKPAWLTNPLMQDLQLDARTGCIVSGDTLEQRKPHPAPLLHACELLQCNPGETVYVGDARRDIEAGASAGMTTLVAAYGYIDKADNPDDWGADGLVDSPEEILSWVRVNGT